MVVTVEDEDSGGKSEVVDVLVVSRPSGVLPDERFSSAEEVRGNAGRGFLRFNYRLTCTDNFTGDMCTECSVSQCTSDSESSTTEQEISTIQLFLFLNRYSR